MHDELLLISRFRLCILDTADQLWRPVSYLTSISVKLLYLGITDNERWTGGRASL